MASKKYIVREGFVVALQLKNASTGQAYERLHVGGEEVVLEDEQAAAHIHKLEFANQKDRDAALAAEREAAIAARAAGGSADLVGQLVQALQAANASAAAAPSPAPAA